MAGWYRYCFATGSVKAELRVGRKSQRCCFLSTRANVGTRNTALTADNLIKPLTKHCFGVMTDSGAWPGLCRDSVMPDSGVWPDKDRSLKTNESQRTHSQEEYLTKVQAASVQTDTVCDAVYTTATVSDFDRLPCPGHHSPLAAAANKTVPAATPQIASIPVEPGPVRVAPLKHAQSSPVFEFFPLAQASSATCVCAEHTKN